jgi:arylsulfatase A-like enzyme
MTVLGAALLLVPTPSKAQLSSFWGNWLTDLLPDPVVRQYLERQVPLHPLYAPPVLLPGNLVEVGSARPNILLVVLESTRSDLLSAYSGKPSLSPFLDELATQSIVVDQMYTTVSHTTKALVGILCGMKAFPSMKAVEARPGGLPVPCLPRLLQQAGYTSGFFQSASNFERRTGLLQNMGFEQYFVPGPEQCKGFTQVGYLGWEERILRKPASTWMAQVHKPFFATVLTLSTHHPYDSAGTGPATAQSNAREHYDAAVRYVDEQVRGLFQDLKDAGVLENTIVLLMGDHGEAFDDHSGFRQHDSVPYDEVMRVPMLIYGPKFFQPRRLGGLRQHTDVVPTVLELAKQGWDGLMPGSSLLSTPGHEAIVASCWYPHTCLSLRSGNLSFVFHYGHVPLEVYDLAADPGQRHDIAPSFEPALRERAIDLMLGELASIEHYYRAASGGP